MKKIQITLIRYIKISLSKAINYLYHNQYLKIFQQRKSNKNKIDFQER